MRSLCLSLWILASPSAIAAGPSHIVEIRVGSGTLFSSVFTSGLTIQGLYRIHNGFQVGLELGRYGIGGTLLSLESSQVVVPIQLLGEHRWDGMGVFHPYLGLNLGGTVSSYSFTVPDTGTVVSDGAFGLSLIARGGTDIDISTWLSVFAEGRFGFSQVGTLFWFIAGFGIRF